MLNEIYEETVVLLNMGLVEEEGGEEEESSHGPQKR